MSGFQYHREHLRASRLAAASPRVALGDPCVSDLFAHYVTYLAPWYDLNDSRCLFGVSVPSIALDYPLLFGAIIAFAASHKGRIFRMNHLREFGSAFHSACIQNFLCVLAQDGRRSHDNELAATCLLRSYEIIEGQSRWSESHCDDRGS